MDLPTLKGNDTGIDKLYIDNNHKLLLDKPENAIKVNVACYTLRDIRKGVSTEYPIVKIGAQYWMGKELHATTYRDGAPLKNRVTWEQTKPDITSRTNMTFIFTMENPYWQESWLPRAGKFHRMQTGNS